MFDVRFNHITAERQKELGDNMPVLWHEDVMMFAVWDNSTSGHFMGYAYFDFYPREGKYTHAGHYSLQPVSI
jgi:metallopeptidase MepB